MTISDDQKKRLTMFLGECYHETEREGDSFCDHCGEHYTHVQNRYFSTPQDMMDLKDKLVEKGMWDGFSFFAFEKWDHKDPSVKMVRNYFTDCLINPATFIPLVTQFLEGQDEKI